MKKTLHILAKQVLWKRFTEVTGCNTDAKGYVDSIEKNLLPGITPDMFESDLAAGSGNELENKFKAVHSSSALAVNTFAPFKNDPGKLVLAGKIGFTKIQFEKQCPTGLGGTPPNLDLVAESDTEVVGVESKFMEYLTLKKPHFADSYRKENLPQAEECWLDLIVELKGTMMQALEAAQLVKHYLGLQNKYPDKKITLLYLFWEPRDWQNFELFRQHRKQIEFFVDKVKESEVSFAAQSYPELWDDWKKKEILGHHVTLLSERYGIDISPD